MLGKPVKNDAIFQLSLTELAFTLAFLLLLLLGRMVVSLEQEKRSLKAQLVLFQATQDSNDSIESKRDVLEHLASDIKVEFSKCVPAKAEEFVSRLESRLGREAELRRQAKVIENLNARVSALAEVKRLIDERGKGDQEIAGKLESALATQAAFEAETGKKVVPGKESDAIKSQLASIRRIENADKENKNLRGQVAFLSERLNARGGRDHPPCWADEHSGKVQYLFHIQINDDGLAIRPDWPAERAEDAKRLPGIDNLVGVNRLSLAMFREGVAGIDRDSKAKNCRHYVQLAHEVRSLELFNAYRLGVEEFFYKFEIRR